MTFRRAFRPAALALCALAASQPASAERNLHAFAGASSRSPLGRGAIEAGAGADLGPLFAGFSAGVRDRQSESDRRLEREFGVDASSSRLYVLAGARAGRLTRSPAAAWFGGALGRYAAAECEIPARDDPFERLRAADCTRLSRADYGPAGGLSVGLNRSRRAALAVHARWTRRAGFWAAIGVAFRIGGDPDPWRPRGGR